MGWMWAMALLACSGGDGNGVTDAVSSHGPEANDPGRVALHRLNRSEYDATVRDLLGTALTPSGDFPPDNSVAGFDNIASNLTMSTLHVELYELAATALAEDVLARPVEDVFHQRAQGEGPDLTATTGGESGEAWNLWSNGDLVLTFDVPIDGLYELSTRVWAQQAGPDLAQVALGHDGFIDSTHDVAATSATYGETHVVEVPLTAGPHTFTVSFLNDFYDPGAGADRNLLVDWLDAFGPTDLVPGPNPLRDALIDCDPEVVGDQACADQVLADLAFGAYRRPVDASELGRLSDLAEMILADGGTFDEAMTYGMVAILTSPHFLFRVELDADPTSLVAAPLDDYELASRLSYFLWSSMPDAALFEAAARGDLQTTEGIEAQVRRMIADPKAEALVDNFGGQWLFIRGIDDANPDPGAFPQWDPVLQESMKEEMRRFFSSFVFEGRDLRELLTATEGEIDGVLADHYGVTDHGNGWESTDLAALDRGGILGQAGLLTVNAYPARTSPVVRGKFVLGQLLCDEPPPPPPGVEGFDEDLAAQTLREQLEQHRADPVCASCHEVMDELGFGLEHFDALGQWRDDDRGLPIDAAGRLPDGTAFYGAQEMAAVVAADPRYGECLTEKLFTYALGRVPTFEDHMFLDAIEASLTAGDHRFEELAVAIATSSPFRMRRGEP